MSFLNDTPYGKINLDRFQEIFSKDCVEYAIFFQFISILSFWSLSKEKKIMTMELHKIYAEKLLFCLHISQHHNL